MRVWTGNLASPSLFSVFPSEYGGKEYLPHWVVIRRKCHIIHKARPAVSDLFLARKALVLNSTILIPIRVVKTRGAKLSDMLLFRLFEVNSPSG